MSSPLSFATTTSSHHITIMRILLTLIIPALLTATACADDYFPPPDSQGGWRALNDAAQVRQLAGMHLDRLENAFEFTSRCSQNGGLLVVRHGYLVFEKYFGRAHRN